MQKVLFDTAFIIRLMNESDPLHDTIRECFQYCLDRGFLTITSAICISEYAIKADPCNIVEQIKVLPFTGATASTTGKINHGRDAGDQRDSVKDDYKIIATAIEQGCNFIVTTDARTLKKYADRCAPNTKTIVISEDNPFNPQMFNDGIGEDTPLLDERLYQ